MGLLRESLTKGWPSLKRETIEPVAGTEISLQSQISAFWETLRGGVGYSPRLLDRVWAANRCVQLNSQQVASMPLRFYGTSEPAWVSNPDPTWYPNGIGDAVFAAIWSMYGWGDAFLYVTSQYANGFPSGWTVLHPEPMSVTLVNGRKQYKSGQQILDADRVIQVTRDPRGGLRGTSAFESFAPHLWAAEASAELGRTMVGEGATPKAVLKAKKRIDETQAQIMQSQWATATAVRRGLPAVLGPDWDYDQLAFSPKDLLLLDVQQFEARVIAAACGVPPFLLNLPLEGGLTYQSPEMLTDMWWRVELNPASLRLSRALSANMLPRGSWVEFDAEAVRQPSFGDLVTAWDKLLEKGVVTVDEYRAAVLRLPPLDEDGSLELLTVPSVAATSGASNGNGSLQKQVVISG